MGCRCSPCSGFCGGPARFRFDGDGIVEDFLHGGDGWRVEVAQLAGEAVGERGLFWREAGGVEFEAGAGESGERAEFVGVVPDEAEIIGYLMDEAG